MARSIASNEVDLSGLPLLERARMHKEREAVLTAEGRYTYADLLAAADRVAHQLLSGAGGLGDAADLGEMRVAFAMSPGFGWVATLWGIWRAGGVAVPLCLSHPLPEQQHVVQDAGAGLLVFDRVLGDRGRSLADSSGVQLLTTEELLEADSPGGVQLPRIEIDRRALIIYSSGTTGKPKGVVSTHRILAAQIESLVEAWQFTHEDHSLLVLPLHHLHGIVVVVACTLWAGGRCEMMPNFDATAVWERLSLGEVNLFMGVPTVYSKLVEAWEAMPTLDRLRAARVTARMRLMACGSAALSKTLQESWLRITGHVLLERYGATETGIMLSNPLVGERRLGYVGSPLPGVELRLVGENGEEVEDGSSGEIEVRGPTLFLEYWRRPDATRAAYRDGWYRTGDLAVVENGAYRILGRKSVDILKSGGFKISALEIEATLLEHPAIRECAVVGVPDEQWGDRVAAALVLEPGSRLDLESLRAWSKERLAAYKLPTLIHLLDALPRNAMGKIVKPAVLRLIGRPTDS